MTRIRFEDGAIEIDAAVIAEAPEDVQAKMRDGKISSLCERGANEDAGTYRLSFFTESKRLRLVVTDAGEVLRRTTIGSAERPLASTFRGPGT